MAKKRKIKVGALLILIVTSLLVFVLLVSGFYSLINYFLTKNTNNNIPSVVDPTPIKTNETVKVTLNDYQIFEDDNNALGFNFIIANMTFTDDDSISFDLGNLQTSEKIYLNNVSKYLNVINEKSYKLDKYNIVNSVVSNDNSYTCNIFVPYTTDSYYLRLLNTLDASKIEFDLTKNLNNITGLKFETKQDIDVNNSNITISSSSISTMMLHNNEEYQIPSTMNVYTFRIFVNEVQEGVRITDAKFVRDNYDEVIDCMSEDYESIKCENIINKDLTAGENGALFFEDCNKSSEVDYAGSLMLKFSNSEDWIKVSTILE